MAKSDKSTVELRIGEILRLLLAGGEFEDIRQYSAAQDWKLSNRQLRRYQERAYRRLANMAHRDQKQLLGRHLMQRRALYARAMKVSDVKTALNVLKDEAQLQGLYSAVKNGEGAGQPLLAAPGPISREERFYRTLSAEAKGDEKELRLMEHLTPEYRYRLSDLTIPRLLLHLIAMTYVSTQLDRAGMFFMALWRVQANDDPDGTWDLIGGCHAYRFRIEVDAWEAFTAELGVDGRKLVEDNHQGTLLPLFEDQIYERAPTHEEFVARYQAEGGELDRLQTAEQIAEQWRRLLRQVLDD
jgi:hypothetical protein